MMISGICKEKLPTKRIQVEY